MMKPREQSADRYSDISLPLPDSLCSAMNSSSRREQKAERGRQEVGRERTGLSSQASKESAADQGVKLIYIPSSNSVAFDLFFFFCRGSTCLHIGTSEEEMKTELPAVGANLC